MRHGLALFAAGTLVLVGAVALASDDTDESVDDSAAEWNVDDPGGEYREIAFDADEGAWISVDVNPDGTQLVFDLIGDIWTVPIDGGDATLLSGGLAYDVQPRWSPDGQSISFTSDRGGGDNIWLMDADGGNRRALTDESFRLLNNAVWHPSGDFVIAKKHFTSRRSLGAGEMWMYHVSDARKGVQLTERKNDQQDVGEPEISPDGRHLYWSEDMSGGEFFEYNKDPHGTIYVIRRMDMESGEIRDVLRLQGGAIRPQLSPDGKTLAFVRRIRDNSVLAVYDLESGVIRNVWDGLSIDQQETWAIFGPYPGFDWTPDGKTIVIWAQGKLNRVDVASGEAAVIPFNAAVKQRLMELRRMKHSVAGDEFDVKVIRWPQLTADSSAVFQALGKLYRRSKAGEAERITTADDELEFAPSLSADGKTIVYVTWSDTEGGRVKSVGIDGSNARTLVDQPGHYLSATLSADGREVLYHRSGRDRYRGARWTQEPGIYRKRLDEPREPRFLTRAGRKPRYSPDGRRILLIASEGERAALVSIDRMGSDRRVLCTSERATDFAVSPDGKWLAFEELWQTYVIPFPPALAEIDVGPDMKSVPIRRLSSTAGTYLSWSADSSTVAWSLGPDVFQSDVDVLFTDVLPDAAEHVGAFPRRIGWAAKADVPATNLVFTNARIAPMDDLSVIEDGVVWVQGNRIRAVGPAGEVEVPDDAERIDCGGKTLMPGLVDVHSHTGSSSGGIQSQQNWAFNAMLAFGVTTSHDPSNNTQGIYAESEMVRAGLRVGPRILSTGTILYGADGNFKAVIDSYEDAKQEIERTIAWGPISVKSYNQPRRDQRQQVMRAAAELGVLVVPEGGSTLHYNITHLLDGHTTLEHAIPVAPLYEPELRLMTETGTCYTPTLVVGYGGLMGENYWYAKTDVWSHERLERFVPRSVIDPAARRRTIGADDSEYHHLRLAEMCAEVVRRGGNLEIGAHGQLQGLAAHWETWMFEQGGLTPHEALRAATYMGAVAICLDHELGSVRPGMLADLIVVDGDPLGNVRDSERVVYTMINGRLYDAGTLQQLAPERRDLPQGPPLGTILDDGNQSACRCGR